MASETYLFLTPPEYSSSPRKSKSSKRTVDDEDLVHVFGLDDAGQFALPAKHGLAWFRLGVGTGDRPIGECWGWVRVVSGVR